MYSKEQIDLIDQAHILDQKLALIAWIEDARAILNGIDLAIQIRPAFGEALRENVDAFRANWNEATQGGMGNLLCDVQGLAFDIKKRLSEQPSHVHHQA